MKLKKEKSKYPFSGSYSYKQTQEEKEVKYDRREKSHLTGSEQDRESTRRDQNTEQETRKKRRFVKTVFRLGQMKGGSLRSPLKKSDSEQTPEEFFCPPSQFLEPRVVIVQKENRKEKDEKWLVVGNLHDATSSP